MYNAGLFFSFSQDGMCQLTYAFSNAHAFNHRRYQNRMADQE